MSPAEAAFYRDVGKWIARERARVELTQADLAKLAGLSREAVSSMEHGHQRIHLHDFRALEAAFHQRCLGRGSVLDRSGLPGWRP